MTEPYSYFAEVAACSNLSWDSGQARYVIDKPRMANIAADTIGRRANGPNRDKTALIFEHDDGQIQRFTFAEINEQANRLAVALRGMGVAEGDPVAVHDRTLFVGYWGDLGVPERLRCGDWLRTGDLAKRDGDGYYWYQGRNDDLIKSAGYRIGPTEIEDTPLRHADVVEAAVLAKPDPERVAIVVAFVKLAGGKEGSPDMTRALQDFAKQNLALFKYPREVRYVSEFPLTSSLKIRWGELRRIAEQTL